MQLCGIGGKSLDLEPSLKTESTILLVFLVANNRVHYN